MLGKVECDRITKGLDDNGKPNKEKWAKVKMREKELRVNGMKGHSCAFTDTVNSEDWGGVHRGHLGCVVNHAGTVYAWVPTAPARYGFPRFLTGYEITRALGHESVAHVAVKESVSHSLLQKVAGHCISAWSADVVGDTLEVAFPGVFDESEGTCLDP